MDAIKPIRRLLLTAVLAATCLGTTQSIASAETRQLVPIPQDTDKVPFRPQLTVDESPLCDVLFDRVTETFFSDSYAIDIRGKDLGAKARWIFTGDGARKYDFYYEKDSLRLFGKYEHLEERKIDRLYVWTKNDRSYKGPFHEIRVYSDTKAFFSDLLNAEVRLSNHWAVLANGEWQTSSGVAPELIEFEKRFYLLSGHQVKSTWSQSNITLSHLDVTHKHRKTDCSIRLPISDAIPTSLEDFIKHLRIMVGYPPQLGTYPGLPRLLAKADGLPQRLLFRPWVTYFPSTDNVGHVERTLHLWQYKSLRSKFLYREFSEKAAKAEADLAAYYMSNFSYSQKEAQRLSDHWIGAATAVHFRFGGNDPEPHNPPSSYKLRRAILSGVSTDDIRAMFDTFVEEGADPSMLSNEVLRDSLERLDIMDFLLSKGADINKGNEFGKTPLMLAAHLNLPESVKWLIAKGAAINRETFLFRTPVEFNVTIADRTALFYAAENASPAVIRDIIAAGANLFADDTKNRDVLDYLDLNESLSDEDREALREEILAARG